jgi:hypothetical protein
VSRVRRLVPASDAHLAFRLVAHIARLVTRMVGGFVIEPHIGVPNLAVDEAYAWFRGRTSLGT